MSAVDVLIVIACFILIILAFLQPTAQDKLAGFLSGSLDPASSYQNVKERGTTKILLNLTIFFILIILILLIIARTQL